MFDRKVITFAGLEDGERGNGIVVEEDETLSLSLQLRLESCAAHSLRAVAVGLPALT